MCGITGIWELNDGSVPPKMLSRFTKALKHRGPDAVGCFQDPDLPVGLGHCRLAILDLSEKGSQPMSYADGRYWITYNGEIYNFIELRDELRQHGYRFRSETDTEVILAAYDRWGRDCQLRFNGMWAFAIWDRVRRELFLSRDRFGVKPLHYSYLPNRRFAFASELKAFKALDGFEPQISPVALRAVLTDPMSLEGTEVTLFKEIFRLPAGHCGVFNPERGLKLSRWWCTLDHLVDVPASLQKQADRFRELFLDACRLRMRSDVPIGTALSGGLDSTSVFCSLAHLKPQQENERVTQDWQHPFVATFPGTTHDETEHAVTVTKHLGIPGQFLPITPESTWGNLDRILSDFEEIYISPPDAAWFIYREMRRQRIVVTIDGHGADELLAGYPFYIHAAMRDAIRWWGPSPRIFDHIKTHKALLSGGPAADTFSPARLLTGALKHHPVARFLLRLRSLTRGRTRTPSGSAESTGKTPRGWLREPLRLETMESADETRWLRERSQLDAELYRTFHYTVLPTILRNFDRTSMAHGVEVRMPFMDWRLVTFCFSLPPESKMGGGFTKRILREAMRGIIPETVRLRTQKIGLNAPLVEWFRGPLKEMLDSLSRDSDFIDSDIWDGKSLSQTIRARLRRETWTWNDAVKIWPFIHSYWYIQSFAKAGRCNTLL